LVRRDVVSVVLERRRIEREQPDRVGAEVADIVQLLDQPAKIAVAVGVRVAIALDVELVDDGVFVPESVGVRHNWSFVSGSCIVIDGGGCLVSRCLDTHGYACCYWRRRSPGNLSSGTSLMLVAPLVLAMQLQAIAHDTTAPRALLVDARLMLVWALPPAQDTQPNKRRRAIQYSDAYYTRLQIHRVGSWLELP